MARLATEASLDPFKNTRLISPGFAWKGATAAMILLFQLVILVVVSGSCAGWVIVFRRMSRKQPVLLRVQRRPAPWGLLDLLLATLLLMTFQLLNAFMLTKELGIDPARGWDKLPLSDLALVLFCEPAVNLAAIVIALTAIGLRTKARLPDFGVTLRHARQDLWLGAVAFMMLALPVYGLQRVLTIWFPYEHPLISVLQKHPQPILHAAVFFSAVIAAPIVEEFFYRVLWQGWLQTVAERWHDFFQLVLGNSATPVPVVDDAAVCRRQQQCDALGDPDTLLGGLCHFGQFGVVRLDAHLARSRPDSAVRAGRGTGLRLCENRPRVALHRGPRLAERLQLGNAMARRILRFWSLIPVPDDWNLGRDTLRWGSPQTCPRRKGACHV